MTPESHEICWIVSYGQMRSLVEAYLKVNAMEYDALEIPEDTIQAYEKVITREMVNSGVMTLREQQHLSPAEAHEIVVNQIMNEFPTKEF